MERRNTIDPEFVPFIEQEIESLFNNLYTSKKDELDIIIHCQTPEFEKYFMSQVDYIRGNFGNKALDFLGDVVLLSSKKEEKEQEILLEISKNLPEYFNDLFEGVINKIITKDKIELIEYVKTTLQQEYLLADEILENAFAIIDQDLLKLEVKDDSLITVKKRLALDSFSLGVLTSFIALSKLSGNKNKLFYFPILAIGKAIYEHHEKEKKLLKLFLSAIQENRENFDNFSLLLQEEYKKYLWKIKEEIISLINSFSLQ